MKLAPVNESLLNGEDHSWLASRDGIGFAHGKILDGTACGAIYPISGGGIAKSGTILALNTSTQKLVPFTESGSNGTGTAYGFLFTSVEISDGLGNFIDTPCAVLKRCQVYTAKLPRSATQVGGPYADAISGLTQVIFR
jgi:hypothetical protein